MNEKIGSYALLVIGAGVAGYYLYNLSEAKEKPERILYSLASIAGAGAMMSALVDIKMIGEFEKPVTT